MEASGKKTTKSDSKSDLKNEIKQELKSELKNELKTASKSEKEPEVYTGHKSIPLILLIKYWNLSVRLQQKQKKRNNYVEQDFS